MKPAAQFRQGSSMKCRPHYKKDGYAWAANTKSCCPQIFSFTTHKIKKENIFN